MTGTAKVILPESELRDQLALLLKRRVENPSDEKHLRDLMREPSGTWNNHSCAWVQSVCERGGARFPLPKDNDSGFD